MNISSVTSTSDESDELLFCHINHILFPCGKSSEVSASREIGLQPFPGDVIAMSNTK